MHLTASAKRLALARLANVATSPAPPALTSAAAALHSLLVQDAASQDQAFLDADDALAEVVADLPGTFATQLDLLGVLHGKEAQLSQRRRRNISAALRDKAARLDRALTDADFPSGHPVPLFASAYWGGVEAWSAGSPDRAQHPKGYWAERANQIAALQSLAARHPNQPITHAQLHAAGLHRLASIIDAAELQVLADEASVDRRLLYRPRGWWTAERAIDAYAEACRKAGVTLSTTALSAIGGEASALRSCAKAHFATFRAFQRAVVEKHADIKLPDRPVAADGTPLDSWSEVPVYNALRMALPDAHIEAHVIIAGERARSTDFVLDDRVWVEVLGIAVDAMATPTSARQAKYAADWKAKSACYVALGIDPVLIEPDDIHDVERLAARIKEIATRLRCDPLPLNPPSGKQTRAKGFWTFYALCAAVEEVARDGIMPTHSALQKAGYGHTCCLLKEPGMRESVTAALGLSDPNRKDVWTRERVVAELAQWVRGHEAYPTEAELRRAGHSALGSARSRLWAGQGEPLRKAVGDAAGITVPRRRAPDRSYATIELVAAALAPLAEQLGRMPTGDEATAAGLSAAWAHASRRGGVLSMAERIGVPCQTRRDCSRPAMLAAFSDLATSLGHVRLTTTLIRAHLGARGLAWVGKLGGVAAVRTAIADMTGSGHSTG
jgi:hypothetical protein